MPDGERFCPYVGLTHYSEQDAPYFFGRDAERELLSANLLASRLTVVYGPSGVGKSSVLRAGVAHHLKITARQNLLERGSPEYAVTVFNTWRDDPLAGLLQAIARDVKELTGVSVAVSTGAFTESLAALALAAGGELLIILDQFEEYFLYHAGEDGPGTFAWEFPKAVEADLPVGFLISIREDSLARLDRFKGRIKQLFDNYLRVGNLDEHAARAAIVLPLREFNRHYGRNGDFVAIERALVRQVIRDVSSGLQIGDSANPIGPRTPAPSRIETPYLQLIMMRLWEHEHSAGSRVLRLQTLINLGSAAQIVRTHLDTALSALSAEERDTAAEIFRHLVTPSRTKIAHTVIDLAEFANVEQGKVEKLLEKLSSGSHRILGPVAPAPDQPTNLRYQIFHDVLAAGIVEWRRTRENQHALEAAARREQEQRLRAEREAQSARRLRILAAGLAFAVVFMIAVVVYAVSQRNAARNAQKLAEQRDIEKLTFAGRAEQQKLLAEAERKEKLGFQKDATDLRKQADELGKRASNAEQLAKDQGIRVSNATKETGTLQQDNERLKAQNQTLSEDLRKARKETETLQKEVDALKEQLKLAAARKKKKDDDDALAAKGATKGPPPPDPALRSGEFVRPKALVIGISRYGDISKNPWAGEDSRTFGRFIPWAAEDSRTFGRFLESHRAGPVEILVDRHASKPAILRTLEYVLNSSAADSVVLYISASLLEEDGSYYLLTSDSVGQYLGLTAIALRDIGELLLTSSGRVKVLADFYVSGAQNPNHMQSVLQALAPTPQSLALIYIHRGEDNGAGDRSSVALTFQGAAREPRDFQDILAQVLRDHRVPPGNLKALPPRGLGGSYLVYDDPQVVRRRSGIPAITLESPSPSAPESLLADGTDRALARLADSRTRLSPGEFESASRKLLIALEDRANSVIRRSLRAYEAPVAQQDYQMCVNDLAAGLTLLKGLSDAKANLQPRRVADSLSVRHDFCDASARLVSGRYVDAVEILTQIEAGGITVPFPMQAMQALVSNALGMAYREGREFDRARDTFMRAIRAAPHWAYPRRNFAQVLALRGDLALADRAYAVALEFAPTSAVLRYEYAEFQRQRGDKTSAEKLLQAGLLLSPEISPNPTLNARFYVALGQLRVAAGQPVKGREYFRQALVYDPNSIEALHSLASLERTSGYPDEAAKFWREVIRRAPDHLAANLGLGEVLNGQGRFEEAIDLYSRALQGNPESIPLLKTAAGNMLQAARPAEAEALAKNLLNLTPRDPEVFALLGDAQSAQGKRDAAVASYSAALAFSPSDRLRRNLRAKIGQIDTRK